MWIRLRSPSGVKRGIRKQETPPSACARTRNASHIGAEKNHLWPVISYSPPGPPPFIGRARGGVRAHVGAALLLGHPHPAERAGLVGGRHQALAVVVEREEARLPLVGQLRLLAQRRDHRVGHRDRAADPGVDLAEHHHHRAAGDVRARARLAPGRARGGRGRRRAAAARARRGGRRPRRCGCRSGRGCAASAGSRSPRRPSGSRAGGRRSRPARGSGRWPTRRPRARPPRPAAGRPRTGCSPRAAAAWLKTSWVAAAERGSVVAIGGNGRRRRADSIAAP